MLTDVFLVYVTMMTIISCCMVVACLAWKTDEFEHIKPILTSIWVAASFFGFLLVLKIDWISTIVYTW